MMESDTRKDGPLQAVAATASKASQMWELEVLYQENAELLLRTAYRVLGNMAEAEDALHTVFVRLLKRGDPGGLAPSPVAYLRRAAVNAALDLVRKRRFRSEPLEDAGPRELRDPGLGADERLDRNERKAALREALTELSERSAEMIGLHYFEGLDQTAIAEIMGTSRGTVAVTIFRARRKLERALAHLRETER